MLTLDVAIFHSFASLMSVESQCAFIAHLRRLLEWELSLQYALDVRPILLANIAAVCRESTPALRMGGCAW